LKKDWGGRYIDLLLTFTGAFLMGITFLHLLPDAFHYLGSIAGALMLAGFFAQQAIQQLTHGVEHGHHPLAEHNHSHPSVSVLPVFFGLAIHAFSEGLPLGIIYSDPWTLPALVLAIGLHKIPECMLVTALFKARGNSVAKTVIFLVAFSSITPLTGFAARITGQHYTFVATFLKWCIPFVGGVFIQIATTIFFESSSKLHDLKWKKWLIILAGLVISLLTLV
jgi:zinc transporter ZupT